MITSMVVFGGDQEEGRGPLISSMRVGVEEA